MSVTSEVEKRSQSKVSGTNGSEDRTKGLVERERLRMMMLIRRFEEKTEQAYKTPRQLPDGTSERLIGGFCHLYSGQEAIAVGIAAVFNKGLDALINGYRCHGHSLPLGMDPRVAIAELFGRETGCSKGKSGSMHLFQADVGNHGGHRLLRGTYSPWPGIGFRPSSQEHRGVNYCPFRE